MKLKKLLSFIIIIIISYFLLKTLLDNWQEFIINTENFRIIPLILSLILLFIFYTIHSIIWKSIIKKLGYKISIKEAIKIRAISEIGRYAPGKVWHFLGRTYFSNKLGIPKTTTLTSLAIETLSMIASAGAIFLLFSPNIIEINILPILLLLLVGLIILRSKKFSDIVNNFLIKKGKIKNKIKLNIPLKTLIPILFSYGVSWIIIGGSLLLTIKSLFPEIDYSTILSISGIFAISWVIGYISFLTPGGIGIREGTMTILLSSYMPQSIAIIVPILFRIITIISELFMVLITSKIKLINRIVH
jgi:glycosyltransferase 2 family protein